MSYFLEQKKKHMKQEADLPENYVETRPWYWGDKQHTEREHQKLIQEDYERDLARK